MRIPVLTLIILYSINIAVDWYIFFFLKKNLKNKFWSRVQFLTSCIFALGLISFFFMPVKDTTDSFLRVIMWTIFCYITVYLPKYIFVLTDSIARIPCVWKKKRLTFINWIGVVISTILFFALWWGALFNRFNIHINEVSVEIKDLPKGFENFKIAQISDLHIGSFGNDTTFVSNLVSQVNALHPNMIVFTGDLVNRKTEELSSFLNVLSKLKAKDGVFSILGNHDYGDYYQWPNLLEKNNNNQKMEEFQSRMGWKLLKNDYQLITAQNDTLVLIGVENIGDPPFHIYGDLKTAYRTPEDKYPKILLTHNPAHWTKDIADSENNIALTLSGHTHAMQISFMGLSPSIFRYKTWGGLYSDKSGSHQLYVNIGAGTVGFPARIGATPEITLITLHAKRTN